MADSTIHFAAGLAVGTCIFLPTIIRKIRSGEKTAAAVGQMLATSYALAAFSITPNLLRHAGLPEFFCSGWWMNLFLLNPVLDKIKPGGMLVGEILIVLFFIAHYLILLAALAMANNKHGEPLP